MFTQQEFNFVVEAISDKANKVVNGLIELVQAKQQKTQKPKETKKEKSE